MPNFRMRDRGASRVDKQIERDRYDQRASVRLTDELTSTTKGYGNIPEAIREPYLYYAEVLRSQANARICALEIGAGMGEHTGYLLEQGAWVTATDISIESLKVLHQRHAENDAVLDVCAADMEALPFASESFDLVAAAGCLSYGDASRVLSEIDRILRPNGVFVCVDSLNDNPVYRFNRWLHYLRGGRSKSTLVRMPSTATLTLYASRFNSVEVRYFGALTFLLPVLRKFFHEDRCANILSRFDRFVRVQRSAFKFVMVARKSAQLSFDEPRG